MIKQIGFLITLLFIVIPVSAIAPVASFTSNINTHNSIAVVPTTLNFNDTSTNTPTVWSWLFGDEDYNRSWTQITADGGFIARRSMAIATLPNGHIVWMGGFYSAPSNDTWVSNNSGSTWVRNNISSGWVQRYESVAVAMPNGDIILMGGHTATGYLNDVWKSSDEGVTWSLINSSAGWLPRSAHTAVLSGSDIVLMGGQNATSLMNDVWLSSDSGVTWHIQTPSAIWPPTRNQQSVILATGQILAIGGYNSTAPFSAVWGSSDKGITWTVVNSSAGWIGRYSHSVVVMPDNTVVLLGGYDGTYWRSDFWISHNGGKTWSMSGNTSVAARSTMGTSVQPNGTITLYAGFNGTSNLNDAWSMNISTTRTRNASHTFTAFGNYSVSLTALNTAGFNSTVRLNYVHPQVIIGVGDSRTAGVISSHNGINGYLGYLLDTHPEWIVINNGVGGATTTTLLANITTQVINYNPDIVLYEAGINDVRYVTPTSNIITNLLTYANLVTSNNTKFYFNTIIPASDAETDSTQKAQIITINDWVRTNYSPNHANVYYNDAYVELNNVSNPCTMQLNWSYDGGLHPNALGNQIWGQSVDPSFPDVPVSGFIQQDLVLTPLYILTISIRDSTTGTLIPSATIVDNFGNTYTTSNGTFHLTYPFSTVVLTVMSTGYTTKSVSYIIDSSQSQTVQLVPETPAASQNTWYTPHQVRFKVLDSYGAPLSLLPVNATAVANTLPSNSDLQNMYGINPTAANEMLNNTLIMQGTTGNDGAIVFTMLGSIGYNLNMTNPVRGGAFSTYVMPIDSQYNIWVNTSTLPGTNPQDSVYLAVQNTSLWFSEPNVSYIRLGINYTDTSGKTTQVNWFIKTGNNNTVVYTKDLGNPGTGMVTDYRDFYNKKGYTLIWNYTAVRTT